jgi:tartrate dehydrogenase/decarboxylase/D-malate dehydrogenase
MRPTTCVTSRSRRSPTSEPHYEAVAGSLPDMARGYLIDVIPGDGIGLEVMPPSTQCIDVLAKLFGFTVTWRHRDWGSARFLADGKMMPATGIDDLSDGDAILLGAVGSPAIPDDVTLWGLLIPIRRSFHQYVNVRPVRVLPGVRSPLVDPAGLDVVVVRENVEGEYSEVGGRHYRGRPEEMAIQEAVFTRAGIERVAQYAADLARERRGLVVSATKSNGLIHSMPFWDEVVAQVVSTEPALKLESVLIDALAARAVLRPGSLDVVVASNLFGDILSDLLAALAGSIGVAPSANLNPPGDYPSMFEPVHGSAPDIAGRGIANPIGQMWAAAMMLDHLGEKAASATLIAAFEGVLRDGIRTQDLGGRAGTSEFAGAVQERLTTAATHAHSRDERIGYEGRYPTRDQES